MDPRLVPLAELAQLHNRLFRNCLLGVSDAEAAARPSRDTNSFAFVASHVAGSRYFALKLLGAERPDPLAETLGNARSIDEVKEMPSIGEIAAAWQEAGDALLARFEELTAAELDAVSPARFPTESNSLLAVIGFLVHHEAYHIGQLSLLRKYAGFPAMKYA